MPEVLGNEPRPAWRWALPLSGLLVVAVVVAVVRSAGPAQSPNAEASASASATPSPTASPLPTPGSASGACGGGLPLPLVSAGSLPARTGLRLLVGDRDLRVVDVDTGRTTMLRTLGPTRSVTALVRASGRILAVLDRSCTGGGGGEGQIVTLDPGNGQWVPEGPGEFVFPGTPTTILEYGASGGTVFRDYGSTASTRIPDRWFPIARRGSGYFVVLQPLSPADPGALGTVGVGDPATGRLTQPFGSGSGIAAAGDKLVWLAGGCGQRGPCLLSVTGPGGMATAQPLPGSYACCGTASPDGNQVAFRLSRAAGRFGGHPGPPNDVAVLDIPTGGVRVIPGLVLPTKSGLTLAWSADSQWLVIGADLGTRPLILVWRDGMALPAQVPVPPTGGGTTGPPALLVLSAPQSR